MKLIAGLGNPGGKYERSRHNLGFICVNYLANQYKIKLNKSQSKARTGTGSIRGEEVILARPQTFMNLSGQSIKPLMNKFHLAPEDIIIIHDDLDLPVGKIRVKLGGGSGGHNGISSIMTEIRSRDFNRIRIGIGRPPAFRNADSVFEDDVIDYVLGLFSPEEKEAIEKAIPQAAEAIISLITEGLNATMNRFNSNNNTKNEPEK